MTAEQYIEYLTKILTNISQCPRCETCKNAAKQMLDFDYEPDVISEKLVLKNSAL